MKYLDNPVRRIDIRFVNYDSFYSALLYFTGSAELNKQMRQIAKTKNLKLSEYGLFKENGEKIPINNERDIFDILEKQPGGLTSFGGNLEKAVAAGRVVDQKLYKDNLGKLIKAEQDKKTGKFSFIEID